MFSCLKDLLKVHQLAGKRATPNGGPIPRSHAHLSRRFVSNNVKPTHDPKWKVLERPYQATLKREIVQTKRKVALKVAYTGTGFYGSQKIVDGPPTIEGAVETALWNAGMILESNYGRLEKIGWSRSSRTDKGVHSLSTVFGVRLEGMWPRIDKGNGQFEYEIEDTCLELPEKINAHLPDEIRVLAAAPVPQHFDARKSCIHRHYEYLLPLDALKDSVYMTDPGKFTRLLNLFVGRHHWHNFGQIPKKKQKPKLASNRKSSDDNIVADEIEAPSSEVVEIEPSILSTAPRTMEDSAMFAGNARPSLYALDEFKAASPKEYVIPKSSTAGRQNSSAKIGSKSNQKQETHVIENNEAKMAEMEGLEELEEVEDELDTVNMLDFSKLNNLTPKQIAEMPLDHHLTHDSFHRTISAVGHDEIEIMGSRYVRISIQGDSFLLHQVRRMVGALVLAAKGIFSEEALRAAIDAPFRILTPRAPPQGLLLRDARFLDVDFRGRDATPRETFCKYYIYPHMHKTWIGTETAPDAEAVEGEAETIVKDPWYEVFNSHPIPEIREVIPGYDDWVIWHENDAKNREIKRQQRREKREERSSQSRDFRITTRSSF